MAKLICANYNTQGKKIYIYLDELDKRLINQNNNLDHTPFNRVKEITEYSSLDELKREFIDSVTKLKDKGLIDSGVIKVSFIV